MSGSDTELHAAAVRLLSRWAAPDHGQESLRQAYIGYLHARIGRWVQLGGHCEPQDASVEDAALREAIEESGIGDLELRPGPLHLDVHPLTCSGGVPTRHFDVRFLVVAPPGSVERISSESLDLRWFGFDDLPPLDASTHALVRYADSLS